MSTTLPLFWHLSSAKKKERLDASVKLVVALEHFQSQFVPKDSPETSEDEDEDGDQPKSDGLKHLNAQDVAYSIRRLIRGLASPRESSRIGFAVALTEVRTITLEIWKWKGPLHTSKSRRRACKAVELELL